MDLTIFFALGSGILISFKLTSLKLINIFAKIGNNIIEKTKIFFEDIWKQNNQINTSIKLPINISVNSKKVKQIQFIETYLAQLDLVSNFYVTSFNNNNTIYKIIFNGNPNQFLMLMKEKNIDIDTNQEIWKVR